MYLSSLEFELLIIQVLQERRLLVSWQVEFISARCYKTEVTMRLQQAVLLHMQGTLLRSKTPFPLPWSCQEIRFIAYARNEDAPGMVLHTTNPLLLRAL
jgi:hypothetical protein